MSSLLLRNQLFRCLSFFATMALLINFWLVFSHDSIMGDVSEKENPIISAFTGFRRKKSPHLAPPIPFLPPFAAIENGQELAKQTINGSPTIAGIVAILNEFLSELHISTQELNKKKAEPKEMIESYFSLTNQYIMPLEKAFQGRPVFPIRDDDSIFISLAAFREHLLNETLQSAFENALRPDHLFIGAIVQNCFGWNATCKTGNQVIGKNDKGRDIAKISDAPPDRNGIEEFCSDSKFAKYCENGQIRVIYVQDIDAKGPAWARYFASKLWGGETYYMQMDSHLHFAPDWDRKYIEEIKAAKAYPKAVLSAYPPGFSNFKAAGNKGNKLCYCSFGMKDGEEDEMIRINTRSSYHENETRPTQIAFIAAGFFFARSNFLVDIPFDPYLPWCFMGEEIMLSMRAWTSGWGIYAPRKNLIAHQYRPGRMGLPKFWEAVGRETGRPGLNSRLMTHLIRRVQYMVGYPKHTRELIDKDGDGVVLTELDNYGFGTVRSREDFLKLTQIDVANYRCNKMKWCDEGEIE